MMTISLNFMKLLNHSLKCQRYWETCSCYHDMATIFNDVTMHSFIFLMSLNLSRRNLHKWINVEAKKAYVWG